MLTKEQKDAIEKLNKDINKKFGTGTIARATEHNGSRMVRMPTGILSVDIAIGGGFVKNSVNIFFGRSSQGKSTLALHALANFQRQGLVCAYIYTEGPIDETHLKSCGVNLDELQLTLTNSSEEAVNLVQTLAQSKIVNYILVDSIQGLVSQMVLERSAEERTMGADAFMCAQLVKKFTAATTCKAEETPWCALTLINQGSDPMGGGPLQMKGGEVQQFFSVQTLEIRAGAGLTKTGAEITEFEKKAGHRLHFKVRKNKTFPPFKAGYINYYVAETEFGCGRGDIDHVYDTVQCGIKYGLIEQAGAWITYNKGKEDEQKFQGVQAYADHVRKMSEKEFGELRKTILKYGVEKESNVVEGDNSFEEKTDGVVASIEETEKPKKESKKK